MGNTNCHSVMGLMAPTMSTVGIQCERMVEFCHMGVARTRPAPSQCGVGIVASGMFDDSYGETKPSNQHSGTITLATPLELDERDIQF